MWIHVPVSLLHPRRKVDDNAQALINQRGQFDARNFGQVIFH